MAEEIGVKIKQLTDFRTIFLTSIISALALVVGLFWNEAVKSAIERIVPQGEGPFYKFLAAVIVTVLVVVLVYVIVQSERVAQEKFLKRLKEQEQFLKNIKLLPTAKQKASMKKKKGLFKNLF